MAGTVWESMESLWEQGIECGMRQIVKEQQEHAQIMEGQDVQLA